MTQCFKSCKYTPYLILIFFKLLFTEVGFLIKFPILFRVSFALDNILQMFSNEDSHWLYHAMVYLKNGFNSVDFKKVIEELRKDIENKNITMIIVKCVKMVLSVVAIIANFSLFPYANVFKSFCLVGQVICDYLIHKIIAKRN